MLDRNQDLCVPPRLRPCTFEHSLCPSSCFKSVRKPGKADATDSTAADKAGTEARGTLKSPFGALPWGFGVEGVPDV